MSNKTNIIQKITQWKVVLVIQVIASLVFLGLLFKLGALPMKYMIIVIVVIVLLCAGMFFLMKPSDGKGKIRNIVGKIISILLSILLLVGSLYIAKGDSVISSITGANEQVSRISVVVLKDSSYKELSDLKGKTIEFTTSNDEGENSLINETIKVIQKNESSINTQQVKNFNYLGDNLYNKKTEAILVDEASFALLEVNHENFENETRVIWTHEITKEVKDFSKAVDVTKEPFVVYISGIDTYGNVSTVSRSDVNMMVTVNPKTKQILMTSIPRDYFVTLANRNEKDKLTHSGLAGVENTVKTMSKFMDVPINYYAKVNFTSLIKIVDALGGVDINSTVAFTGYNGTHFKKGINHINGKQALEFSRERHAFGGGDNERVHNQQVVLTAMIKKMISPTIITNYNRILSSIDGSFETNMASSDITGLLQMQISDMSSWNIVQKQLVGTGKKMTGGSYMPNNALYYMIPNEKSVQENKAYIEKVMNGEIIN